MDTFTRISVQQAHEIMQSPDVTIVDVRDPGSFVEGHILKAQSFDESTIKMFLENADKESPLICYCYHGISSQRAASFFADQGFKQVYSMDGGWEEWKSIYG